MTWNAEQGRDLDNQSAMSRRLDDLALALVIPRSWPGYYWPLEPETHLFWQRAHEVLEANKNEILPWPT